MKKYRLFEMKRILCITILSLLITVCAKNVRAQSSLNEVLWSIEQNNKTLQSAQSMRDAYAVDAQTGRYLSNPTVEYNQLWGQRKELGRQAELTVSQEFDFPTVYANRNKIASLKTKQIDQSFYATRQNLLLEAKIACLELIFQQRVNSQIIDKRYEDVLSLQKLYKQRLESGDANILEINKIELELLDIQAKMTESQAAYSTLVNRLTEMNGGSLPNNVSDLKYPAYYTDVELDTIIVSAIKNDPRLSVAGQNIEISERSVSLAKGEALPKFSVGYRGDYVANNNFNGVQFGVSVPLWENKNRVKSARAQAIYAKIDLESQKSLISAELQQMRDSYQTQMVALNSYEAFFDKQNNLSYLAKALKLGEMSLIDYLKECQSWYDAMQNYLRLECDIQILAAKLSKINL